jgi:hypothetical protein
MLLFRRKESLVALIETDELTDVDRAFAGNRLLSTFSQEARALIENEAEIIELGLGETILERGRQV